jgi:hypothetical protein
LPETLPFNLDRIASNISKVIVKGGLASKICHVLIVVAIAMAIISWSVKLPVVAFTSLGLIFILSFVMLWRLISLADKNPHSALMEGAEYLVHEQIMIGTKNQPWIPAKNTEVVVSSPAALSPVDQEKLNRPEDQPKELSSGNSSQEGDV